MQFFLLQGSYESQLKCDVINVEEPVFLSIGSEVHGLTVSYKITRSDTQGETTVSSQRLVALFLHVNWMKDLHCNSTQYIISYLIMTILVNTDVWYFLQIGSKCKILYLLTLTYIHVQFNVHHNGTEHFRHCQPCTISGIQIAIIALVKMSKHRYTCM